MRRGDRGPRPPASASISAEPTAGAVRLGRLLRRETSTGAPRASLSVAQQRAYQAALAGEPDGGRGLAAAASGGRGWWWAAAGVTVAAAVIALSATRAPRALTFELDGVRAQDGSGTGADSVAGDGTGASLEPRGPGGAALRFSDGSTVALAAGARARVLALGARGARVAVERGDVAFEVRHRPAQRRWLETDGDAGGAASDGARWLVAAGPFEVVVTGTAFDVSWAEERRELRLRLREGGVVVRGSLAGAGLAVRAGQTFEAKLATGEVRLGATSGASFGTSTTTAAGPAATATAAAGGASAPLPAPARAPAAAGAAVPAPRTSSRTASATTRRAPEERPAMSDEDCLAGCDDEGLDVLARAARRRGDLALATRALVALRKKSGSEQGHEAAFMLGRMSEDGGRAREALSLYDAYLGESGGGHYRPYALGRKMALVEQLDGAAAARPLAETYLRLYPDGAHGTHARQLLARP